MAIPLFSDCSLIHFRPITSCNLTYPPCPF